MHALRVQCRWSKPNHDMQPGRGIYRCDYASLIGLTETTAAEAVLLWPPRKRVARLTRPRIAKPFAALRCDLRRGSQPMVLNEVPQDKQGLGMLYVVLKHFSSWETLKPFV